MNRNMTYLQLDVEGNLNQFSWSGQKGPKVQDREPWRTHG